MSKSTLITKQESSYINKKEIEKNLVLRKNLIYSSDFNSVFKNGIRDYYTYGFKGKDDFLGTAATITNNWRKVANVLGDEWMVNDKKVKYITYNNFFKDYKNLLNRFYLYSFFSNITVHDLYVIFQLSPDLKLFQELSTIVADKDVDNIKLVENIEQRDIDIDPLISNIINRNWIENLKKFQENKIYTTQQLKYFIKNRDNKGQDSRNKTLIKNLSELNELGIIKKFSNDDQEIQKWIGKLYTNATNLKYKMNTFNCDQKYWCLSSNTMEKFYENFDKSNFRNRFLYMIQFFSQYFIMGEIGELLTLRSMNKQISEAPFRYRQNYLTESLLDYNLYDLLVAIENNYWCYLKVNHGTNCKAQEYLVLPLQIRISSMNGREHVMYYNPIEHQFSSERLDFIDEIILYKNIDSVKFDGKYYDDFKSDKIKKEIKRAKELLNYVWGVDTTLYSVENPIKKEDIHNVVIEIEYNPENENYIRNRFYRECRSFEVEEIKHKNILRLKGSILAPKEMQPWIRSFYTRLLSFKDNNKEVFVDEDIEKMHKLYQPNSINVFNKEKSGEIHRKPEKLKSKMKIRTKEQISENEGHGALYHSVFSLYTIILADSILSCGEEAIEGSNYNISRAVTNRINKYFPNNKKDLEYLKKQILDDLNYHEFLANINNEKQVKFGYNYEKKFKTYLYNILPITKVECRWLKTICKHPFAQLFLEKEILSEICNYIDDNSFFTVNELPMSNIIYYDRFNQEYYDLLKKDNNETISNYLYNFQLVLKNITSKNSNELIIEQKTSKGKIERKKCKPGWIIFCKRNNLFQLYAINSDNDQLEIINFDRIIEKITKVKQSTYDIEDIKNKIFICLNNEKVIQVEFYDHKNIPDRILTEFSPWKKMCIYDEITEKYTMTLYYYERDEAEILSRLLGYGPYIKIIKSDNDGILDKLKYRIENQYNKQDLER